MSFHLREVFLGNDRVWGLVYSCGSSAYLERVFKVDWSTFNIPRVHELIGYSDVKLAQLTFKDFTRF